MIVGFSAHGTGKAASAIAYLTDRVRCGVERDPPPTVLRGEPELTAALIDGSRFKHRYTSGVLSFAPGEDIGLARQEAIMDRFEATAFAGLDPEQFSILWVRHDHAGHCELNFLVPRVELITGKSLNIAPPGHAARELFDTFRTTINLEYGLADPDDPARAREVRVPAHVAKLRAAEIRAGRESGDDPREVIAAAIGREVAGARIRDRTDVLAFLRNADFEITREGNDYVSVRDPETNDKYRLKGPYFRAEFQHEQLASEIAERRIEFGKKGCERLVECRERLERLTEIRCSYNQQRYQSERSDLRIDLSGDLSEIALERSLEDRHEREGLETARLRDDDIDWIHGVSHGRRFSARATDCEANRAVEPLRIDDDDSRVAWGLYCFGGTERPLVSNTGLDYRQRFDSLRQAEICLPKSQEDLADDGVGVSFAARFREFGTRIRQTGERFAEYVRELAAECWRVLGAYQRAIGKHEQAMYGVNRACERFELATRDLSADIEQISELLYASHEHGRTEVGLQIGLER